METKNMIGGIVSLAVVVICVAAIMMPVLSDAQKNAGEEVTYTNLQSGYTFTLAEKSDVAVFTVTPGSDGTISYNDEVITDLGFAAVSNTVTVRATSTELIITTPELSATYKPSWSSDLTVTFEDGTCTIEDAANSITKTYEYTWIYIPDEDGEWVTATGNSTHYVNSADDIIASGYYSTGENDTGYSVKNGVASVTGDYTTNANLILTLVDGTTDVYSCTLSVDVGDENFTPWFVLIKSTITGHEASGAAYSLYGAIPVIVIVSIVIASIGFVTTRRD